MATRKVESNQALNFNFGSVSFDPEAFDQAILSHGIKFIHYRGMKCPVGMVDRYGTRRAHEDHSGCSNGFIYTQAGIVTCLYLGNTDKLDPNDVGLFDGSTVQVTAPRTYDGSTEEVQVVPYDRFYLMEEAITVPHWQTVETHITGKDKLQFPVVQVMDIIDAHGKRYGVGDYEIVDGQIIWTNGGPGFDAVANKGVIYSIRYTYRPYFYVQRVMHQVRVAQVEDMLERKVVRMPQSFVLQREIVAEGKEENDPEAPDPTSLRQAPGPRQGSYGPR